MVWLSPKPFYFSVDHKTVTLPQKPVRNQRCLLARTTKQTTAKSLPDRAARQQVSCLSFWMQPVFVWPQLEILAHSYLVIFNCDSISDLLIVTFSFQSQLECSKLSPGAPLGVPCLICSPVWMCVYLVFLMYRTVIFFLSPWGKQLIIHAELSFFENLIMHKRFQWLVGLGVVVRIRVRGKKFVYGKSS